MTDVQRRLQLLPGRRSPTAAASTEMAYSAYPLAVYAWDLAEVEQAGFGERAAALLDGRCADVVPEATPGGLTLLARSEPALLPPVARLLAHFGHDHLRLTGPHVRFWPGTPQRWPVMAVRVQVPRRYASRVRFDLVDRGAHAVAVEHGPLASAISAELPQTRLIGYPGWLHDLTAGLCELSIRLSHYAPCGPGPDPGPQAA